MHIYNTKHVHLCMHHKNMLSSMFTVVSDHCNSLLPTEIYIVYILCNGIRKVTTTPKLSDPCLSVCNSSGREILKEDANRLVLIAK